MGRKQLESRDLRPAGELVALADIAAMILRKDSNRRVANGAVFRGICHLKDGAFFFKAGYSAVGEGYQMVRSYYCGIVRGPQLRYRQPS
jgi:hypothetical protein